MRKLKNILIVLIVAISFMSCSKKETITDNSDVIRVGIDLKFPPFSYLDDDGNAAGFEPEIALAFGEWLGKEVEIVNTDFSMLIPALDTGDVDILIADMSATDERKLKADFSNSYRYTYTLALVNKDFAEQNNITDEMPEEEFFALTDAEFIGLSGTMGTYYPQKYNVPVTEITEIGVGIMEVSEGMSTTLVASNEVHGFHAANKDTTIVYSGIKNQTSSAFAVRKGDTELLTKANEFIASMYEDGGFYDQVRAKYDVIVSEFLQSDELGLDYITMPAN